MTEEFDLDAVWSRLTHTRFLESLNATQSGALLRLLMIATFADGEVTDDERAALGRALIDMPAFSAAIDFTDDRGAAVLDNIRQRYEQDRATLLREIADGLGDDSARRNAFRTSVELLQADGFARVEADFVREVGQAFGLEQEVVDFVLDEVS
jgi:tellurite resistance protein